MPPKPISVLIADDKKEDRFLLNEAITHHPADLHVVGEVVSGLQLVEYLSGKSEYADRARYPLPGLLFMDLRMPEMDGFQVLEWLQKHPRHGLKVAVLADSSGIAYRSQALELGADFFYSKPIRETGLADAIKRFREDRV
jgi:two-component system response regulator